MRKILILVALFCLNPLIAAGQGWTFAREGVEYVIELPTAAWTVVPRVDVHEHVEFVNGTDEANGYLRLSKIVVASDTTADILFQSDEKWNLRRLPGYVACSNHNSENVGGYLSGASFAYEYISRGRAMVGRVYYLQLNKRTFYALRFSVAQDKLQSVREQMDSIARSFRLK